MKSMRYYSKILFLSVIFFVSHADAELLYSIKAIVQTLDAIIHLRESCTETPQLDSLFEEIESGNDQCDLTTIRAVLQEAWQIMQKYHAKVDAATLTTWYGRLVEFSLKCGLHDL